MEKISEDDQARLDRIMDLRSQAYLMFEEMRQLARNMDSIPERNSAFGIIESIDAGAFGRH